VRLEGARTPAQWDPVLARRVGVDSLFNLDTIHLGFVRPTTGEDWALAYCQAELYARYMEEKFGKDATARMIAAYAANLDTRAALKKSFGVAPEAFEKDYRAYLERLSGVKIGSARGAKQPPSGLTALQDSLHRALDAKQIAVAESLIH